MGIELKYFVLKPKAKSGYDPFAQASQAAMYTYADRIEHYDKQLAKDLREWVGEEITAQTKLSSNGYYHKKEQ